MPFPFPHVMVRDVTCITPELLRQRHIRALLLDIDGTLMQTRDNLPAQPVLDWIECMKQAGICLYILSNNKHGDRVQAFAQHVGLPWQNLAGKPSRRGFEKAQAYLGLPAREIGVVGDQIFTDVLGARRCGMQALLVESSDTYLWYFYPRRLLEKPFMRVRRKADR